MKVQKSCPHCHQKMTLSLRCAFGKRRTSKPKRTINKQQGEKVRQCQRIEKQEEVLEKAIQEAEKSPAVPEEDLPYMYRGIDLTKVHEEYLKYNPDDITVISDRDVLYELIDFYSPASCPWDDEYAYLEIMLDAIRERLDMLNSC